MPWNLPKDPPTLEERDMLLLKDSRYIYNQYTLLVFYLCFYFCEQKPSMFATLAALLVVGGVPKSTSPFASYRLGPCLPCSGMSMSSMHEMKYLQYISINHMERFFLGVSIYIYLLLFFIYLFIYFIYIYLYIF